MRYFLLLFILLVSLPVQAKTYGSFENIIFVDCYDGDTCSFNIPDIHPIIGEIIGVRIRGFDTPEIKGKCEAERKKAIEARDFLIQLLSKSKKIRLLNIERGKYFRIVATITINRTDISKIMIDKGFAVPYDGKEPRGIWCK